MFYVSSRAFFQEKRRNLRQVPPRRILRKRSHPFLGLLSDRHYRSFESEENIYIEKTKKEIKSPH